MEAGFAAADFIVEGTYTTESVHQSHVEPRVATAVVLPGEMPTVYTNTQLPYWIRTNVAHVLGVPEDAVRIVPTGIGGAFGSKLYPQIEPLTALLSRQARKPVRLVVPLTDELVAGLPRHPTKTRIKSGVMRDGTLVALEAQHGHGRRSVRRLDARDRLGGRAVPGRPLPYAEYRRRCLRRPHAQDQLRRLPRARAGRKASSPWRPTWTRSPPGSGWTRSIFACATSWRKATRRPTVRS